MGDKIRKSPNIRFAGFTDDWEERKLGDYVKITSGESPSKFHEGNCNYVKVDDLNYAFKTVINTQNKVSEHKTISKVKKGSVIFPKRGAAILTNKVRILGIDSYMDTNMMALSSDILDSDFLYIMISKEGLYKIADTSTIPQINNKHIEPYDVILPNLDEQRGIGQFFSILDNLITLHQRKLDLLKATKKSMLQKMFPRDGESVPEIRFAGFTCDWEKRKLGDIVKLNGRIGFRGYTEKDIISKGEGGVLTFSPTNIIDNRLTINCKNTYITRFKYDESPEIKIKNGDILFIKTGSTLGKSALVKGIDEDATLNPQVIVLRVEKSTEEFVSIMLTTDLVLKQVAKSKIGGAVPTITETKIKEFLIVQPKEIAEQKKIGEYFSNLDNLITLHQRELDLLKDLKKSMLKQMFI